MGLEFLAIPLFWITVVSLIPAVPGAMCEFGVFQAGAPWSWADLGLKFFTMFAFGGWLFFDIMNRKLKGSTMMASLSRGFVLLLPLLLIDAILDISFFGGLSHWLFRAVWLYTRILLLAYSMLDVPFAL